MNNLIGLFHGAFDPITTGHVQLINAILNSKAVESIEVLPDINHPFDKPLIDITYRVALCDLALKNTKKVTVHEWYTQPQYTIDYIINLKDNTSSSIFNRLRYIIGQDNADNIHTWHKHEELINLIPFIVIPRKGCGKPTKEWYSKSPHQFLTNIKGLPKEVSSTEVRNILKTKKNPKTALKGKVVPAVADYIIKHQLYR